MFIVVFLLTCFADGALMATFETKTRYQIPPEDAGIIFKPVGLAMEPEEKGRIFVLDADERKVFIWDHRGTFIRTLGRKGEGPGELMIEDGWAKITVTEKHIMVIDDRVRAINLWDKSDYSFLKKVPLKKLSRVADLHYFKGDFLFVSSNHRREDMRLLLVDQSFTIQQELCAVKDAVFKKNAKNGWIYNPMADRLIMNTGAEDIWYANTNENWVSRIDRTGKTLKQHRVPLFRLPVTVENIQLHRQHFAKWKRDNDIFKEPREGNFLDILVSLNNGLLIAAQLNGGTCKGLIMDKQSGKVRATFSEYLGEDTGDIVGVHGEMIFITVDEDGIHQFEARKLVIPGGSNG